MRPDPSRSNDKLPSGSQPVQPITFKWFNSIFKLRPEVMLFESLTKGKRTNLFWSPLELFRQEIAGHDDDGTSRQPIYQRLKQYSQVHGTFSAYELILSVVKANYDQLAKRSSTNKWIGDHSMSMMPTFQGTSSPQMAPFSVALSKHALKRAPAPLPDDATPLQRLAHHILSVNAYTLAHNDAYKSTGIDRHFTSFFFTECVIAGKGLISYLPQSIYTPVNEFYGKSSAELALFFNPAKDYDGSDFAKRLSLYSGVSLPVIWKAVPKLFAGTLKAGSFQARFVSVSTSFLFGGLYEVYCGYSHGTSYITKPLRYLTFFDDTKKD